MSAGVKVEEEENVAENKFPEGGGPEEHSLVC